MIQAGAMRVEPVSCAIGLGVQAERLPSIKREHGVVEAVGLLVLVENGLGGQQLAKPASASPQVSHGHLARSVGHRRVGGCNQRADGTTGRRPAVIGLRLRVTLAAGASPRRCGRRA